MKLPIEEVIQSFKNVHGDKYDYSKMVYITNKEPICIICPTHGEFWQTPKQHKKGQGCPKCGNLKKGQALRISDEEILARFHEVHGDKYDYSKAKFNGTHEKVCIICPKHGEFWQEPKTHISGCGCAKCYHERQGGLQSLGNEEFVRRAKEVHGDKYDYSRVEYESLFKKVCIICPIHGEFWQRPANHLDNKGCPKCGLKTAHLKVSTSFQRFLELSHKCHGDKYDYSKVEWVGAKTKIPIICPTHGEFWQIPMNHMHGQGCAKCAHEKARITLSKTQEQFEQDMLKMYGDDVFDWSQAVYKGDKTPLLLKCKKCGHAFQTIPNRIFQGHGCPYCVHTVSRWEKEVGGFVQELGVEISTSNRAMLNGRLEIDIFIPNANVGIECDGLRWHSTKYKGVDYHLSKTRMANERGIHLIHLFEDEWLIKQSIIKSIISGQLGLFEKRIYARKCQLRIVDEKEKKVFLNENHIQGNVPSKVNLGLYFNDELISIMTFGKQRKNVGTRESSSEKWELLRFCNKLNYQVIGGASRLFKHFIENYDFDEIKSFCDIRLFKGELYEKLGFELDHYSKPNYYYVKNLERFNRFGFRKDILVKEGFDPNKSEREIMEERGYNRIYDCGCKVYLYKKK